MNKESGVVGWLGVGRKARVCEERWARVAGLALQDCRLVGGRVEMVVVVCGWWLHCGWLVGGLCWWWCCWW